MTKHVMICIVLLGVGIIAGSASSLVQTWRISQLSDRVDQMQQEIQWMAWNGHANVLAPDPSEPDVRAMLRNSAKATMTLKGE